MLRALVTGSSGFIGRHMVAELEARGYEVTGSDITTGIDAIRDIFYGYENDSPCHLMGCCGNQYDLVVHCAYHVGGRASIDGVNQNFAKNLQLDSAMFEWAVRTKQKRVLYFSSSAAYPVGHQAKAYMDYLDESSSGSREWTANAMRLTEGRYEPLSPVHADANYGFAKCVGERLAEDARKNGLAVTVVRPFSGYGEDQSFDYPFPSIVRRASGGDLSVWGPPGQTRDWIHVSDVVRGALGVVESETVDAVNLCTGRGVEMGKLATMIYLEATKTGMRVAQSSLPTYLTDKPTGVFYRVGDPSRMLRYYEPKITLEEGIQRALRAQA